MVFWKKSKPVSYIELKKKKGIKSLESWIHNSITIIKDKNLLISKRLYIISYFIGSVGRLCNNENLADHVDEIAYAVLPRLNFSEKEIENRYIDYSNSKWTAIETEYFWQGSENFLRWKYEKDKEAEKALFFSLVNS